MASEPVPLPFTDEARRFVDERGYGLDELVGSDDIEMEEAREFGERRVLASLTGEEPELPPDRVTEILSYTAARVIVSCFDDRYLVGRFARHEAEMAAARVGDPAGTLEELGYGVSADRAPVGDYLDLTRGLNGEEWRLVNRRVAEGVVDLGDGDPGELLKEAARRRISENLPAPVPEEVCQGLKRYLGEIAVELEQRRFRPEDLELDESCFPPCIQLFTEKMESGEYLPHTARFAVTAFLRQIGVGVDEIVDMFDSSPDFDEEKTRYQVEHISGVSGDEYTPPSCSTMKTYGDCPGEDRWCEYETVTHPLSYYRWALKRKGEMEDRDSASDGEDRGPEGEG